MELLAALYSLYSSFSNDTRSEKFCHRYRERLRK